MSTTAFDLIKQLYERGLESVEPTTVTIEALNSLSGFRGKGRIVVVAIGKAAEAMALAAQLTLGASINRGVVVAKQSTMRDDLTCFDVYEAGHPIPTGASLQAGEAVVSAVSGLKSHDTVIALISGGGSALLEVPVDGVSLAELQVTTELLMFAGADIHQLNTVRRALSAVKGGGLRRAIGDARCITLILSDVLGNDPAVIASGLTIPTPRDLKTAWQILRQFRIEDHVPESVRLALLGDSVPEDELDASRDEIRIIADNETMLTAIANAATEEGYAVEFAWRDWRGDARALGERMVADCLVTQADILIGGGEATCRVHGSGRGGRNTEAALIAALALRDDDTWTIASLASDGDDGNSGAAGGIVDGKTIDDENVARVALAESNTAGYLGDRGALLVTGQSGTNVNDIYVAVRNNVSLRNEP
ncbi:MAG: DUF4147 domain-containing protein [Thermomicrobiales bacterium]|nr:DUF4147 domain-containing protein [Thermomicrobiales bacterium]